MLAVGLEAEELQKSLLLTPGDVCIACENYLSSITSSGPAKSIVVLPVSLSAKGIFARELRTGRAYHSPYMSPASNAYDGILSEAYRTLAAKDLLWSGRRSPIPSSVKGELIAKESPPAGYWSVNLVLFDTAIPRLIPILVQRATQVRSCRPSSFPVMSRQPIGPFMGLLRDPTPFIDPAPANNAAVFFRPGNGVAQQAAVGEIVRGTGVEAARRVRIW